MIVKYCTIANNIINIILDTVKLMIIYQIVNRKLGIARITIMEFMVFSALQDLQSSAKESS